MVENLTYSKLIATAEDLVFSSSYLSVSVADICKAAGVNKGSFYYFFKSKEDLLIAAIEHKYQSNKILLDELFCKNKSAMEQLDAFIDLFYFTQVEIYNKYGEVCGCPFINLGSEMTNQSKKFSIAISDIIYKYEEYMQNLVQSFINEGILKDGADVKDLARNIHCYILGVKFLSKIENNPEILKSSLKKVILNILGVNVVTERK